MSLREKSDERAKRRHAIKTQLLYNKNAQYQIRKKNGRHKQNFQYCIVHSIYIYILQDYIEYLQIMTFPNF